MEICASVRSFASCLSVRSFFVIRFGSSRGGLLTLVGSSLTTVVVWVVGSVIYTFFSNFFLLEKSTFFY